MGGMDVEGVLGWPWGSGSRTNTALLHLKGLEDYTMAAGFGRGGRAEALLKALNQPIRKPGERLEEVKLPQSTHQAVGRSALLQQHATRTGVPAAIGGVQTSVPAKQSSFPVGRGRSAMLQAAISGHTSKDQTQTGRQVGQSNVNVPAFAIARSSASSGVSSDSYPPSKSVSRCSMPITSSESLLSLSSSSSSSSPPDASNVQSDSGHSDKSGSSQEPMSRLQHMLQHLDLNQTVMIRKGSKGQEIPICANYIPVHCENKGVYLYSVSFSPAVDSKSMRFHFINEHVTTIGTVKAFDGALLFLPIRLPQNKTVLKSVRPTDGEEITIFVTLSRVLAPDSCVHLYNIIFRRVMSILKMCQVRQQYYDPHSAVPVPQHKLEVWPGYVTAVNEYEGGLMMLVDVSHRVLRTETVWDIMADVVHTNPANVRKVVTEKILGHVVLTRYNNRTYTVDDIMWDKTPLSTFTSSSGQEMTFAEYYKKHHNKEISDLEQPLLVSRPRKQAREQKGKRHQAQLDMICLIPELCYITGLTDEIRKDFRVMKDLSLHTRLSPAQRQLALRKFCDNVNSAPDARAELEKWGLRLDMDAIQLVGRRLPEEQIIFKNHRIGSGPETDWSRSMGREHVLTGVDLTNWIVLFTKRDAQIGHSFIQCIQQVSPTMGWQVVRPVILELVNDRTESYLNAIRANLTPNTQMVVAIFPTSRDDRYNAFKKLCCVEAPVPSQVINTRTISRKDRLRSIVQKITLQMNCKLGGELWHVNIPTSSLMVCGIDTYHSAANKHNSVGGFVASINNQCTQWFSVVCHQAPGQELIDGLKICLLRSLRRWHEANHTLPERIIIFRDGVGEGDLAVVGGYEVEQLRTCFPAVGESYQPKLGVVVVQKRINTRLFSVQNGKRTMEFSNPPPGTIMDHTVTSRNWYDFYLVSQHVRQGTVTPTHYVVVHDNTGWCPDFLQQLSYKMTHMYYNWSGTIRVPAPCLYAHKLAYQVGQNLHKDPSIQLCDRLFYL
ncbi:hypothetical protein LSH36_977g02059 [Paralvinella palmiformis]|uniref:Piwi-like protein 2 n=1 Tax=Paralvinella palmiformis TaxID=53620 RepID=A0AAD9MR08_9ANNE|nr:hypothetical protein LSH36_977g02059 [Paralvinella palmiformis]